MKKVRKIARTLFLKEAVCCWLVAYMCLFMPAQVAMANPNPGSTALPAGLIDQIGINDPVISGNNMSITQTANEAIINWQTFDIGRKASVTFDQPDTSAAVLNRVHDGAASGIMGTLSANGRVFIINPAGVVFGTTAVINVNQLVASSLNISNDDFLSGNYTFTDGFDAGDITFNAKANNVTAERIYLVGKYVRNKGGLVANDYVIVAAGDTVTISEEGSSVAVVIDWSQIDPTDYSQFKVDNREKSGDGVITKLEADHIILAAGDLWSQAISNVKTATIAVAGEIKAGDLAPINAYSEAGSDAVADISISSLSAITLDDAITATALGNGTDNAYASITVSTGGDLTIKSKNSSGTTLTADASGGAENSATISFESGGAFVIDAPDQVTAQAQAAGGELSQAQVNIAAASVLITATDEGVTSVPATVSALAKDAAVNRAGVDIQSAGDVAIIAAGSGGDSAIVQALAKNGTENYANVTIDAVGNVDIIAQEGILTKSSEPSEALVRAEAIGACVSNEASVEITAGGDINVKSDGGNLHEWKELEQAAYYTMTVKKWNWTKWKWEYDTYTASSKYVKSGWTCVSHVYHPAVYSDHSRFTPYTAAVEAVAQNAGHSNAAAVNMTAGGNIEIVAQDGGIAKVNAYAGNAYNSENTAAVKLTAEDGYVLVEANGGQQSTQDGFTNSNAYVNATAENAGGMSLKQLESGEESVSANSAKVTIFAKDIVEPVVDEPTEPEVSIVSVEKSKDGSVLVHGLNGGTAAITANANSGDENTADILICVEGGVEVLAGKDGSAQIAAFAKSGNSNSAAVGIGAKGQDGVSVIAERSGGAAITSEASDGNTNKAETIVCTEGGVTVWAHRGGDAEISSLAQYGLHNDAFTGIGARGDVVVQAGDMDMPGCDALIRAEAQAGKTVRIEQIDGEPLIPTTHAKTVVFTHEGDVKVLAYNGGHSGIEAEAHGGHSNTAEVGVAAAADLSPDDVIVEPQTPDIPSDLQLLVQNLDNGTYYSTGNVIVEAYGWGSEAQILAFAHSAMPIPVYPDYPNNGDSLMPMMQMVIFEPEMIPGENTAKTVICAPGEVRVSSPKGSYARIRSRAGYEGDENALNIATTKVYASDVTVEVYSTQYRRGISAYAQGVEDNPQTENQYCLTVNGEVALLVEGENGSSAELIIQDYSQRTDCPDCPPCPCEQDEDVEPFAPAAPLAKFEIPRVEGCPALTQAAAAELEITSETLQVAIGNAMALNPDIQPCNACQNLLNAAAALQDIDGARMAALAQVFSTQAPADAPFTPEVSASIAMAFATLANEDAQYALAAEYVDAFVRYVAVIDTELRAPVGDAVAFAVEKYGAPLMAEGVNPNIAAYLFAQIEGM